MALNEQLAARVRAALAGEPSLAEKRMFGGLAFMVEGAMAVAASSTGGLLVRVEPSASPALCEAEGVEPMVMRGRPMAGWLRVEQHVVETDAALLEWVERGVAFVKAEG